MRAPDGVPETEHAYLTAATGALRTSGGAAALDTLGWWDLLAQLQDPDARTAAFVLFRAQGRELASSVALGGLLAQPYLDRASLAPGSAIATVGLETAGRGARQVVVGDPTGHRLLIDRPGEGAVVVGLDHVTLRPLDLPGRLVLHEVVLDRTLPPPTLREVDVADVRDRSRFLGRLALALEIAGAAEGAVGLAVEHARHREQFGEPIGRFQAVRHLLAWAGTDCIAATNVARRAVALDAAAPPRTDEVAKAIAGRNGRRACERALQVLGGIGFTAEHAHHHAHRRVLVLDALLGSSAALTGGLGSWLRTERADPGFARAVLTGG